MNLFDERRVALLNWLEDDLKLKVQGFEPASGDASFRRYFRVGSEDDVYIAMDAPPPQEDVRPFIRIAEMLAHAGLNVPRIHAQNAEHGFLLLSDLGATSYLDGLNADTAGTLYKDAFDALSLLQRNIDNQQSGLPAYDATRFHQEMNLFRDWFLNKLLGIELPTAVYENAWPLLVESALEQPPVCVHRDYHSRNLMITPENNPGVLDFQDALIGPITYDLVSLLRDCYIAWPQQQVESWLIDYYSRLRDDGLLNASTDLEQFTRWFDLMGLQRHLKAIGIFARLKLRDNKSGYLPDIPRTLKYAALVCDAYPELRGFGKFLKQSVAPTMPDFNQSHP